MISKDRKTGIDKEKTKDGKSPFETSLKLNLFYDVRDRGVFEKTESYGKSLG